MRYLLAALGRCPTAIDQVFARKIAIISLDLLQRRLPRQRLRRRDEQCTGRKIRDRWRAKPPGDGYHTSVLTSLFFCTSRFSTDPTEGAARIGPPAHRTVTALATPLIASLARVPPAST